MTAWIPATATPDLAELYQQDVGFPATEVSTLASKWWLDAAAPRQPLRWSPAGHFESDSRERALQWDGTSFHPYPD